MKESWFTKAGKKIDFTLLGLVLVCIFWVLPSGFVVFPNQGLDWSWMADMNRAFRDQSVFGQDWVFTYGPLGWLITRLDYQLPYLFLFGFDLYVATLLGVALYHVFQRVRSVSSPYGLISALFAVYFLAIMADPLIMMMVVFQFALFRHHETNQTRWLAIAASIGILGFFIKLNLAFIYLFIYLLYVVFQLILSKDTKVKQGVLGFLGIQVVGIVGLSWFLNVHLPGYLQHGLHIISGYQDGMQVFDFFLDTHTRRALPPLLLGMAMACVLWVGGLFLIRQYWKSPFDGFVWVSTSIVFFVVYKHSFTYFTEGPANEIFSTAPALVGLGLLFCQNPRVLQYGQRAWISISLCSILGIALLHTWTRAPWHMPYVDRVVYDEVSRAGLRPDISGRNLDPSALASLKGKTVDVFPDHLDIAIYNDLKRKSRPSIQSYTTGFSPKLQQLNYDFYRSQNAPDVVLFEPASIRNPLYESFTQRALLERYVKVDQVVTQGGDSLFVLAKTRGIEFNETEGEWRPHPFGEAIGVSDAGPGIAWLKAEVEYTLWGSFRRFFLHPPKLWLELSYSDGTKKSWPVSLHTLEQGFPLHKLTTWKEYEHWFAHQPDLLPRVQAVRFFSTQAGFKSEMNFRVSYLR